MKPRWAAATPVAAAAGLVWWWRHDQWLVDSTFPEWVRLKTRTWAYNFRHFELCPVDCGGSRWHKLRGWWHQAGWPCCNKANYIMCRAAERKRQAEANRLGAAEPQ